MHDAHFLTELVLLVAFAAAGAALFERFRLPSIVGFLVVGACVGPGGAGLTSDPDAVRRVAEFGVVFLLFEIGLELPIERLRHMMRSGLLIGALQVLGTLGVVAWAAVALGLPLRQALVFGALLAMSSTALVIRMLASNGELDSPHGQISVAVLLFQDMCIVPFLLAVPLLATDGPIEGGPVAFAMGKALVLLALFFVVARFAVPRLLQAVARLRSREVFSLAAVALVLGAAVAAEELGLTLAVGAFLVGLAARTSPYGLQLFADVVPLRGVLIGIFFTAIGMLLNLNFVRENLALLLLGALTIVVGKALIAAVSVRVVVPKSGVVSLRSGLTLAQTGEFSFVLAVSAISHGLLSEELNQYFVAGSVLSLMATPFLARAAPALAALVDKSTARRKPVRAGESDVGHVVVVGFGLAGRNMARVLDGVGMRWVAVEANPLNLQDAVLRGGRVVYGDASSVGLLESVGIARARMMVVVINDPVTTRRVVSLAREAAPALPILARTRYVEQVDALRAAGAGHVVAEELEGTIDLVNELLCNLEVPRENAAHFADELRAEGYALLQAPLGLALDPWLAELLEQRTTEWLEVPAARADVAQNIGELLKRVGGEVSVLARIRDGESEIDPGTDEELRGGDRFILFGPKSVLARIRNLLGNDGVAGDGDGGGTVTNDTH